MTEENGLPLEFPVEGDWFDDPGEPEQRGWRNWVIRAVAVLAVVALVSVPLGNYLADDDPPVADSGLEICRYDYCVVERYMADRGLELDMIRLYNTILGDDETAALVVELSDYLGVEAVDVDVIDDLEGRLGGVFMPGARRIVIERPSNAWVVAHEVAHVVASGHGEEFRSTLADLARRLPKP